MHDESRNRLKIKMLALPFIFEVIMEYYFFFFLTKRFEYFIDQRSRV
jgi:hypothetical protein